MKRRSCVSSWRHRRFLRQSLTQLIQQLVDVGQQFLIKVDSLLRFGGQILVHVVGFHEAFDHRVSSLLLLSHLFSDGRVGGVGFRHRVENVDLGREILT